MADCNDVRDPSTVKAGRNLGVNKVRRNKCVRTGSWTQTDRQTKMYERAGCFPCYNMEREGVVSLYMLSISSFWMKVYISTAWAIKTCDFIFH